MHREELRKVIFKKDEIKKMRDEIAEKIQQGKRNEMPVYHIELGKETRKFVNLKHILFRPDGYIHGWKENANAISGWIVDPDGKKWMRAFVKIQKIVSPSDYTTKLIIPGIQIAETGAGRIRATIQADAGHETVSENENIRDEYYAAEAWRIENALKLNKLSLREQIRAKILGAEEISDVRKDNTLRKTYDFLMRPKNPLRRAILVNLLLWTGMEGKGIAPPKVRIDPWSVMRRADEIDLARAKRVVGPGSDPYARALANAERKIRNYGRKAEKGGIYEIGDLINVEEARISMLKAILLKYRRILEEKGYK